MARATSFGKVLELADALKLAEKEQLVEVLRMRLIEQRRERLLREARQGWKEYKAGRYKPVAAAEMMAEIMR